jgi:hypothetical protein
MMHRFGSAQSTEAIHRSPNLDYALPTTCYARSQPPVLSPGIAHSTRRRPVACRLYNEDMKSTYRIVGIAVLLAGGCHQHPLTDYRPLDQAGMGSGTIEQLKPLNISDAEIQQLVNLKHSSVTDDTCVVLISTAHSHHRLFTSSESVASLLGARYTESDIVGFARADKLDAVSGDAVMLRLIGLSDATVQVVLQRDLQGLPTLSSAAIGRLKNTGLTEKQILERINEGMTEDQAEKEAASREAIRNHAHTDFVRVRGGKPR